MHFSSGVSDRIRRDEAVMAHVNNHSPDQMMHGLFPKCVTDTVLDAMTDHEKLAMQVLDSPEKSRDFALLTLTLLAAPTATPHARNVD